MFYITRSNKAGLMIAAMLALSVLALATAQAQDVDEKLFWESVDCKKREEVIAYLGEYPQGAYIDEASVCLGRTAEGSATGTNTEQKIDLQLLECEAHFKANRLTSGQGGNALECYKGVLQSDSGNARALAGITAIADKYIVWVKQALQRDDADGAQVYLQRLKTLNTERAAVGELERRIKVAQEAEARKMSQVEKDSALFDAAKNNDDTKAVALIAAGADVNAKEKEYGYTLLHEAAKYNALDVARLLLDHGADVNAKDSDGWTPLHYAALNNALDVVRLLLDHGADVNAKEKEYGYTPLHWAAYKNALDVARLLLDHGADVNANSDNGWTPLYWAEEKNHSDMVQLLKKRGGR